MLSWLEIEPLKSTFQPDSLWGRSPPVNTSQLKSALEAIFEAPIETFEIHWNQVELQEARQRQPVDATRFAFNLNPLNGLCELFIPTYQLESLSHHFIGSSSPFASSLEQSFVNYWMSLTLSALFRQAPLDFIQPVLVQKTVHIDSSQVIQGTITLKSANFEISAQVLLDQAFQESWASYWSKKPYLGLDASTSGSVDLDLHLSLGSIDLSSEELLSLQVGDWVNLESLGLKESLVGSRIDLTLEDRRVASAKLGEKAISIHGIDDFFDRLSLK